MQPPQHNLSEKTQAFARLLVIMDEIRAKCPWDKEQTFASLRQLTLEEVYELSDAILENQLPNMQEELGDLLLHIVFYAKIGEEQGSFDIATIANALCDKMVRRHPHIYSDAIADNAEAVQANWEQLKLKEGKKSALQGVPQHLPAMIKASRVQAKARKVGFDWEHSSQVWDKVQEELGELQQAIAEDDANQIENEFGDVLFALVNYARFLNIDPETALERTNKKFIYRFTAMENIVREQGKSLHSMSLAEMDEIWNSVKKTEHTSK